MTWISLRRTYLNAFVITNEWYSKHFSTSNLFLLVIAVINFSPRRLIYFFKFFSFVLLTMLLLLYSVVNDVNNLLTPIIFMQLLTSGLEICLSGYAMLDNGTKITDILKFTSYFISVTVQLLLWCWPGEILVQESQEVGQIVYFSVPWYNLPPIYRNHVCLMIIRAQQYCSITALTFKVLSIQTLTAVSNHLLTLRMRYATDQKWPKYKTLC